MGRWQPGAQGRLAEAALALYVERGFEQTTVADIAERAGLTERTFFRHFADKREVLFAGGAPLQDLMVQRLEETAPATAPLDAVARAVEAAAAQLQPGREFSRQRQRVIDANPVLRERELIKMAAIAGALAAALRHRGIAEPAASLAAEAGAAVFRVAFDRWVRSDEAADLQRLVVESFAELRAVTAQR